MDEGIKKDVIINVQTNYDEALANLVAYKKEVAALSAEKKKYKEMLDTGMISEEEYTAAIAKTTAEQKNASASAGSWEKVVRNSLKIDKEKTGSLTQMRAQLSNLTNEYNNLSKAERQSAKGTELKDKIKSVSDGLKETEAGIGQFQRNVGNYQNAILDAAKSNGLLSGSLGNMVSGLLGAGKGAESATGALGAMNKQALTLAVNPVVAVLGVIAAVVALVSKGINSSEEATNRWNAVLAPFKRLMDGLLSTLQVAVGQLLSVVEAGGRMLDWALRMGEALPIVGDSLKEVNAQNREAIALAKENADIEKQARADLVDNAKNALRVAQLRKQAKDKEKETDTDRLAAAREADRLEKQTSERNVALAERKLAALKLEASWADNNAETNQAIAQAEADVYNARREYFSKTMELQEQTATIQRETAAAEKARSTAAVARLKKRKADEEKILQDAEKLAIDILEDGVNKQIALINLTYDAQIKAIQTRLTTEKDLTIAARKSLNESLVLLDQRRYQEIDKLSDESINAAINAELERVTKVLEANKDNAKKAAEVFALEWENRLLQVKEGTEAETALKQTAAEADYKRLLNLDADTKRDLYESDAAYTKALLLSKRKLNEATEDANNAEREAMTIKLEAARAIGEGFQNILEAVGESSNGLALAAKAIALFNIGLATAEAIAKGIAASQSVPFPGNLAAIATTIGAVLTNVASAYKIVSSLGNDPSSTTQAGASGGSVSSKVVSATGYSTETVPYQNATTGLYSANVTDNVNNSINNVNLSEQAAKAIKDAVSSLPAPVVSVQDINKGQRKVTVVESTRKLG